MTQEAKIAALEVEVKHLRADLEKIEAIALGNQRMLRWAMGAAASIGAAVPVFGPKLARLL